MNKNILIVLLIIFVPLVVYYAFTKDKSITTPTVAADNAQIIKFSSPMCYECQQLEKVFNEVFPQYTNKIVLKKIDVTQKNSYTKSMISKYNVNLVPTTVLLNKAGNVVSRLEGTMEPQVLENHLKELINE